MNDDIKIRYVTLADLDRCFDIETQSYGGDEAASREKIATRINTYPAGFIVLTVNDQIAGFINSGATNKVELSDESFKELISHDPLGKHIVIMSVVIHPDYQRRGLAAKLMTAYIERMRKLNKQSIYLICQTELIRMYSGHGFEYIGESDSDHGGLRWHEMTLIL